MRFRNTAAAVVVLTVATVMAQGTSPAAPPADRPIIKRWRSSRSTIVKPPSARSRMANPQASAAMHQRLQDMESTLVKMHELLKQMRANAASSRSKDPSIKANLDMWGLMVGHLDKQFEELRLTTGAQEFEARRAALYKQADAKSEAAARAAQDRSAGQTTAPSPALQGAGPNTLGQTGTGQAPPASPSTASPSPN
jgi:hypothetical protein